jgi:UDP-N-acetylglucosamine 3-dehydrogenase
MVGHIVRFDPAVQALKERIDAGEPGRIFQIFCRRISPFPHRVRDVGVVVDLAPHDLDVMHYLTGEEPLRVYAEIARRFHAEYEDQLAATLTFPGGVIGMLEINWLAPMRARDVIVLSERGMFRADTLQQELYLFENAETGDMRIGEGRMVSIPLQRHDPLQAEIAAFAAAVLNDTPVPVTGADGLLALKLALALIQSGAEHRPVEI